MLARRLLALIAVLLVLLAIANAVAPRQSGQPAPRAPLSTTGGAAPQASPAPAAGGRTVVVVLSASPDRRPRTVRARVGDLVDLSVTAPIPGTVAIDGYDLLEAVDAGSPAMFNFIANRAGTFEVSLEEAGAVIGRLRILA